MQCCAYSSAIFLKIKTEILLRRSHGNPVSLDLVSATWLSQKDQWLSVPRLLVVWLCRRILLSDILRCKFNASPSEYP